MLTSDHKNHVSAKQFANDEKYVLLHFITPWETWKKQCWRYCCLKVKGPPYLIINISNYHSFLWSDKAIQQFLSLQFVNSGCKSFLLPETLDLQHKLLFSISWKGWRYVYETVVAMIIKTDTKGEMSVKKKIKKNE